MNIKKIKIGNMEITAIIKDIKNLHLGVYPPNGRVRIAAPLKTSDESIRLFAISKINWIKKQKAKFNDQERQAKREYVSGESHYFFGKRYLLNVIHINPSPRIEIKKKTHIDMYIKSNSAQKRKEKIINDWYRLELERQLPQLIKKWEKIIGVKVRDIFIRKMKTKWGSCKSKSKKIIINLELAKKPISCLEYILVHEMIHFLEKNHSDKFKAYMDSFMPKWKQFKTQLNKYPLSYSDWTY